MPLYSFFLFSVPPRIDRSNLKDLIFKAGQNIKLDVKVTGEPPPKKEWFHNKARLSSSENLTIDNDDYKTKLSILAAVRQHSGTYTIKAENDSGKDEATIEITVLGK